MSLFSIFWRNSYLFQELYVRIRNLKYKYISKSGIEKSPYLDELILKKHLEDINTFFNLANNKKIFAKLIPFDISIALKKNEYKIRYNLFCEAAIERGISVLSLEKAFYGYNYTKLIVNNLDRHPNELANKIAAKYSAKKLLEEINLR